MTKLNKQMYYTSKGEKKINCYKLNISKEIVKESGITDQDTIVISAEKNKIIIKKI